MQAVICPDGTDHKNKMRYTNVELWQLIQSHSDFCNFSGTDNDLRDWTIENPGLSIDLKKGQWYDHNTDEGGGLFELAKSLNVLPEKENKMLISSPTARKQTATTDSTPTPNEIWKNSKRNDEAAQLYFTQGRSIPENHYADVLRLFREDHFKGRQIIHPYFSFDSWQSEQCGKTFDVPRIQRIWFDSSGDKKSKKHFGKTGVMPVCFPIPPHNENRESKKAVILEGIENALSIRAYYPESWMFVATCKSGLKRLPEFMKKFEEVLILADHDFDSETYPDKSNHPPANKTGQAEAWRLSEVLEKQAYTLGKQNFSCRAVMPGQTGKDANDSLRAAQLPEFIDGLIDIPEQFRSSEGAAGTTTEKDRYRDEPEETLKETLKQSLEGSSTLKNFFTDWNPTLQTALEKIASGHNVTFETALAAFLGMCSVAIGGNKTIRSGRWKEKAILWIAFHAHSGKAKSPLFRDCGRTILAAKNTELSIKYEKQKRELETWRSETKESRGEQPEVKRKLLWTTYTNLEALTQAHLENPTGIAFMMDELDALFSGRNQYKGGKGDDTAKLLEIWNGHEINNLTIKDYRNISSVFVPIIGGIHTDLLAKIFNPEDLANGFIARELLCAFRHPCPPFIDSKRREIRADISDNEWNSVNSIIKNLLECREKEEGFTFEPEAENILYECHDALTADINRNVQEMESSFQKLKTYSLRLSLLLHCIKGETGNVTVETTLDSITLINWFSENMQAAFFSTYASGKDKKLKKILERLRQSPHPLTVKDLYQAFRKSFEGHGPIKEILSKLVRTGIIEELAEGRTVKYFAKPFL